MEQKNILSRSQSLSAAGVAAPADRPPVDQKLLKQKAEEQIDNFMRQVGYKNPAERTDEAGWRYFELGSASGRACVSESEGILFLEVEASIIDLPADRDLILPLLRELLEINLMLAGEVRVGLQKQKVMCAITYPVLHLKKDDFSRCIHTVMSLADDLDDRLIPKYAGTTLSRTPLRAP